MDMQNILDNAMIAGRAERFKTSNQMTLGEMILKLECVIADVKRTEKEEYQDPDIKFEFAACHPVCLSSWRGSYAELAIEYAIDGKILKAQEFLDMLKEAIGKTYCGYKGGDYIMGKATPMWVANNGDSGETGVLDIIYDGYWVIIKTGKCEF